MPEMSLSEAALWAGKGRPAILKAIQGGRLSARKNDDGQWRIEPSELERVYPPGNREHGSRSDHDTGEETAGTAREIALLRELADREKARADELARERDQWRDQAEAAQADAREAHARADRILTHQPPQTSPQATATPAARAGARRGVLGRLWQRG